MPKLQNVTDAQISEVVERAEELTHELNDMARRIEQGYCDELADPMGKSRTLLNLTRAAADTMSAVMFKAEMEHQKREMEARLRERG